MSLCLFPPSIVSAAVLWVAEILSISLGIMHIGAGIICMVCSVCIRTGKGWLAGMRSDWCEEVWPLCSAPRRPGRVMGKYQGVSWDEQSSDSQPVPAADTETMLSREIDGERRLASKLITKTKYSSPHSHCCSSESESCEALTFCLGVNQGSGRR